MPRIWYNICVAIYRIINISTFYLIVTCLFIIFFFFVKRYFAIRSIPEATLSFWFCKGCLIDLGHVLCTRIFYFLIIFSKFVIGRTADSLISLMKIVIMKSKWSWEAPSNLSLYNTRGTFASEIILIFFYIQSPDFHMWDTAQRININLHGCYIVG